jgi:hypothetical protein
MRQCRYRQSERSTTVRNSPDFVLRTPGHTPGHQACSLSCPGALLYSELRKQIEAGGKPWSTGGLDDLVVSQPSWEGASRGTDGLTTVLRERGIPIDQLLTTVTLKPIKGGCLNSTSRVSQRRAAEQAEPERALFWVKKPPKKSMRRTQRRGILGPPPGRSLEPRDRG